MEGLSMKRALRQVTLLAVVALVPAMIMAAPIHDAASKGDLAKVKALVGKTPSVVNLKDKSGVTPLVYAVANARKPVAEFLISKNANVNQAKPNGVTPLHVAAAMGLKDMAEMLISNKADVNAADKQGRTPLAVARANNQTVVAHLLLAHGAVDSTVASEKASPDSGIVTSQTSVTDLKALSHDMVRCLANGEYSKVVDKFDSTMRSAMPADKLQSVWQSVQTQAGPYKRKISTRTTTQQGYDVIIVTCEFEKAALDLQFVYNGKSEISGFFIKPAGQ